MRQLNKKFKLDEPNLRKLNFIALDLELKMEKVTKLSDEDCDLLKALQAEKQDTFKSPSKKSGAKNSMASSSSPLPPAVVAVKIFRSILTGDSRFKDLSTTQSVYLIKQDKILRSEIVKKFKAELTEDIDDAKLTLALGFDVADVDTNLELEVVDTQEYHELQQQSKVRDQVVDMMIADQAKLQSIKEDVLFEILRLKLDNKLITMEELSAEEKYVYDSKNPAFLE